MSLLCRRQRLNVLIMNILREAARAAWQRTDRSRTKASLPFPVAIRNQKEIKIVIVINIIIEKNEWFNELKNEVLIELNGMFYMFFYITFIYNFMCNFILFCI